MSPNHSIGFCPICGGGLCGIRVCGDTVGGESENASAGMHGFVICDECEAIWLQPDLSSVHQYADAVAPQCPVCFEPLWGQQGRWANLDEIATLDWIGHVDRDLDVR